MNDFRDIAFSKGFMLTRDDTSSVAHFVETPLWDGWTLWSDDFTPTSRATAGADVMVLIRGQFFDGTGVSSDDVASKLAESLAISYEKFERSLGTLLGRLHGDCEEGRRDVALPRRVRFTECLLRP